MNAFQIGDLGITDTIQNPRIISNGLLGYWSFSEGTGSVVHDFSGNNNHGTLVNSPEWGGGVRGGSLKFDGINQHVNLGTFTDLDGATAFTVAMWIKPKSLPVSGHQGLFARGSTNQRVPWIWCWDGASYLYTQIETVGQGASDGNLGTTNVTQGVWTHVVFTWDGSLVKYFLNAVVGAGTDATLDDTLSATNGFNYIGYVSGFTYFNGAIDDVRIYSRALSQPEITTLYNG